MYVELPGNNIACPLCAELIGNMLSSKAHLSILKDRNSISDQMNTIQDPIEIYNFLDQYIIGQDKAKKILSVAAYNHYIRTISNSHNIEKSNILLIGHTGSGKTSLVKALAKALKLPLAIASATSLTEAGYIGDDVETVIQNLLQVAGGNVDLAERGIIFIDEIDKLSNLLQSEHQHIGRKGVQQALLPLIEGTVVSIPYFTSQGKSKGAKVDIDTSNILFICGGAFPDLEDIILKRISRKPAIGFSSSTQYNESNIDTDPYFHTNNNDLREFGIIPELIGRLPVIAAMEKLSVDALRKILTEPKISLVSQYQKLFAHSSIDLIFKEEALTEIARIAYERDTGARALRSIMETVLLDLMFELPHRNYIREVVITKEFVLGLTPPIIRKEEYIQACLF